MAFDLSTAKPDVKTGFDISTATAVQPQGDTGVIASVTQALNPIAETALTLGSGFARTIGGGIAGIAQAVNPFSETGAGGDIVKQIQAGAFKPQTQEGQEALQTLGALVQKGVDIINFPLSGLAGLTEFISEQGLDQAVSTIKSTQEKGISTTAGQRILEETGSPLAATIAETVPTAVGEIIGLKGAGVALKQAPKVAQAGREIATQAGEALAPAAKQVTNLSKAVFDFQSPTKQKIAKLLTEGSESTDVAGFRISKPAVKGAPKTGLEKLLDVGGAKIEVDPFETSVINQGFDKGIVGMLKNSNSVDKKKMLSMVEIMERGKKEARFSAENRPSDVAGDTLLTRYKEVVSANKASGKDLEVAAQGLKGQKVDTTPAISSFIDDLEGMGIRLSEDLKPNFKGSDIEGGSTEAKNAQSIITTTINRLRDTQTPDAFDVHRLKKFIDSQVTFGKTASGLPGGSERVLKVLRFNIKEILNEKFPEYKRANTVFSETIDAIDELQGAAGRKMNLKGPNAEKAVGTLLRRLLSNAQSRINIMDAAKQVEVTAKKHGAGKQLRIEGPGGETDDLLTQVLFIDELDRMFGAVAKTSLQGDIDKVAQRGVRAAASRGGAIDLGLEVAGKIAEKAQDINEPAAFKSIKELLKRK